MPFLGWFGFINSTFNFPVREITSGSKGFAIQFWNQFLKGTQHFFTRMLSIVDSQKDWGFRSILQKALSTSEDSAFYMHYLYFLKINITRSFRKVLSTQAFVKCDICSPCVQDITDVCHQVSYILLNIHWWVDMKSKHFVHLTCRTVCQACWLIKQEECSSDYFPILVIWQCRQM